MDSPENDQAVTKTAPGTVPLDRAVSSSGSPSVQESPIFSYISNLSPIKPVKAAHAVHGILELSSPPPLFTSPSACKSISLKRPPLPQSCSEESKKPTGSSIDSEKSIALITDSTEDFDVKDPVRPFVFSACVDEYPANSSALDANAGPIFTANYDSRRISCKHSAVEEHDDCSGHPCTISDGSAGNTMLNDLEAGLVQRGMLRRCLIFDDDQSNSVASRVNTQNPPNTLSMPNSPSSPDGLEISDLNCADLTVTSSDKQLVNLSQPETAMISTQNRTKPSFAACKPSSIGLHLNSIANSLPTGCSARSIINLSAQRLKSEFGTNFLEISSACINDEVHDNAQHPNASQTLHEMKPLSNLSNQIEHYKCTPEKRKTDSEHSDNFEESRQMSPKKKQKKPSRANEGDGCKSCNCKKTKCLKLYCDCFAAGIYCAEACACQGCSNRPENEQTVLETRRQIESRNPLAFAPRVQHVTATAANPGEDGNGSAPSSTRHKKGCNCKKSGCLKKYCECFQANVGCSDGCRCVGCKNVNGRKEDYGLTKNVCQQAADETSEKSLITDHGKDGPKILLPLVEHFQSPESDATILPSFEKVVRSSRGSDAHDMPLEAREVLPDIFCDEDLNFGEAGVMDSFTPRFEMGGSTCWLSSPAIPTVHSCTSKFPQGLESERADIFEDASSALSTVVEVRSPNQKRISPPRGHLHEAGPSSCVGLRGGRKFILRSVPSFPTITPCLESKSVAHVRIDSDIGDSTSK